MSTVMDAAKWVGYGAAGGAAIGTVGAAVNGLNVPMGAISGAAGGAGLAALAGLGVAIFSSKHREEALEVTGIGVGALLAARLLGV